MHWQGCAKCVTRHLGARLLAARRLAALADDLHAHPSQADDAVPGDGLCFLAGVIIMVIIELQHTCQWGVLKFRDSSVHGHGRHNIKLGCS